MLEPITLVAIWNAVGHFITVQWPVLTFFGIVIRAYFTAKKKIGEKVNQVTEDINKWASKLLDNHLAHIENATTVTMNETRKTNELLIATSVTDKAAATKIEEVAQTLKDSTDKQQLVWQGVVGQLTILEDRTRKPAPKKRAKK